MKDAVKRCMHAFLYITFASYRQIEMLTAEVVLLGFEPCSSSGSVAGRLIPDCIAPANTLTGMSGFWYLSDILQQNQLPKETTCRGRSAGI